MANLLIIKKFKIKVLMFEGQICLSFSETSVNVVFFVKVVETSIMAPATSADDTDCMSVTCRRNTNYEFYTAC